MLAKLETKSNRVKGLSFHGSRPWLLASLHNGVVQLWDYRVRTLLERFDEHEGPVRGVAFHRNQPLFVSGGDDYKVKVWNYKERRCLFTLLGHLDYIRTVEFHPEHPWILSASDDGTIRIWNWQSRSAIAVLTGHNHYVMSATFHPTDDLVASASLDQTVRVWDISGLRAKNAGGTQAPHMGGGYPAGGGGGYGSGGGGGPRDDSFKGMQGDLFGSMDATVKYVLEGHDRGVNWVAFHPTSPLLVSGADDRQVKLWRMNDTKAWEVDTFRGHFNNVSCVLFHPHSELIVSNSEDKTIRVWDMGKRTGIQTFRREHDRFWILAAHPTQNLFAAGHDSGLIVFKLERERPPLCVPPQGSAAAYFVKERYIRLVDFSAGRDVPVLALKSAGAGSVTTPQGGSKYRDLHVSTADRAALLCSDLDGGYYELYPLPQAAGQQHEVDAVSSEPKRGLGIGAVFVGRRRFCVLDKSGTTLKLMSVTDNKETKTYHLPFLCKGLLPGPIGTVLLRAEDRVALFDLQQQKAIHEISVSNVSRCQWADERHSHVAIMSKDTVILADRKLKQIASANENVRIKSGAWDKDRGAFIYTTTTHIKYLLSSSGDSGIVRTLDGILYVCAVKDSTVYCLDRSGHTRAVAIDNSEYVFKHALATKQFQTILRMVKDNTLIGQSIIAYLTEKGYPEVALHFVRDPRTRFGLSLQCGNLEAALEAARVCDAKDCWDALAAAALQHGSHQVAEVCYQRTSNFDRLSFLYLITGQTEKLRKMLAIAKKRGEIMSVFHNALYLGDVEERIRVLESSGQVPLAIVCAITHGLMERAQELDARLTDAQRTQVQQYMGERKASDAKGSLLSPPTPVYREAADENWPQLAVQKGFFDSALSHDDSAASTLGGFKAKGSAALASAGVDEDTGDAGGAWGDDDGIPSFGDDGEVVEVGEGAGGWGSDPELDDVAGGDDTGDAGAGWGDDLDLDLGDVDLGEEPVERSSRRDGYAVLPDRGTPLSDPISGTWTNPTRGALVADLAAAGAWEAALAMLNRQVGAVNFERMKPLLMTAFTAAHAVMLPAIPSAPVGATEVPLRAVQGTASDTTPGRAQNSLAALPLAQFSLNALIETKLKAAYRATTGGQFDNAMELFRSIIASVPLVTAQNPKEVSEARELLRICSQYLVGLRMEQTRKADAASLGIKRVTEMASYFAHVELTPGHQQLALRSAMNVAFKAKCFGVAGQFARRLLDTDPKQDIQAQARKLVRFCDEQQKGANAIDLDYDPRHPFEICAGSFRALYRGKDESVTCPLCESTYSTEFAGQLCASCEISEVGLESSGLVLHASQNESSGRRR